MLGITVGNFHINRVGNITLNGRVIGSLSTSLFRLVCDLMHNENLSDEDVEAMICTLIETNTRYT